MLAAMYSGPAICRETSTPTGGANRWLLVPRVPLAAIASVAIFGLIALVLSASPFPSPIDELEHLSVVAEQVERPSPFRYASEYRVLSSDLSDWSPKQNYINHPSAYYLSLAPFWALTKSVTVLRLINVLLAVASLILVIAAGFRLLRSPIQRSIFAIFAASFPKGAVVAGMINNDNLAACAGAAVFAGLAGMAAAPIWMAMGLALAGWTKLTALIALGTLVGCHYGMRLARGQAQVWTRETGLLSAGAVVGALPYLYNFASTGSVLWFNADHFRVPVHLRPELDHIAYVGYFLTALVQKWPAVEGILPFGLVLGLITLPLLLAASSIRNADLSPYAVAYGVALVTTLLLQITFGWRVFVELGDLTIAQTRYFNVLWPGIALGAAAGAARLSRLCSRGVTVIVIACLLPTMLGMPMMLALIEA